jgi:hypothetical protein
MTTRHHIQGLLNLTSNTKCSHNSLLTFKLVSLRGEKINSLWLKDNVSMNLTYNLTALAITGEYLAHDIYFNVVILLRISLYAIAVVLLIGLTRVQGKHLAFHQNALILLKNHNLSIVLLSIGMCFGHLFDFVRFRTYSSASELVIKSSTCIPIRIIPDIPSTVTQLSMVAMAIERCWASFRFRTYENNGSKLGVVLVIVLVSILYNLGNKKYYSTVSIERKPIDKCN